MIQALINEAVKIATAMNGSPLASLTWIPPTTLAQDPMGVFVLEYAKLGTAADTVPWA